MSIPILRYSLALSTSTLYYFTKYYPWVINGRGNLDHKVVSESFIYTIMDNAPRRVITFTLLGSIFEISLQQRNLI